MNGKKFVTKCCVCGREKTEDGWEFRFEPAKEGTVCSHGLCLLCYETEMMKARLRSSVSANALYR